MVSYFFELIYYLEWNKNMKNYLFYGNNLILPFFTSLILGITFFINRKDRNNRNNDYYFPGILLGLSLNLFELCKNNSSNILLLFEKIILILLFILGYTNLKKKYKLCHYLSLFLTLYATIIYVLPSLSDITFNISGIIFYIFGLIVLAYYYNFIKIEIKNEINLIQFYFIVKLMETIFNIIISIMLTTNLSIFSEVIRYQFSKIEYIINLIIYLIFSITNTLISFKIIEKTSSNYIVTLNFIKTPIFGLITSNYQITSNFVLSFIITLTAIIVYGSSSDMPLPVAIEYYNIV